MLAPSHMVCGAVADGKNGSVRTRQRSQPAYPPFAPLAPNRLAPADLSDAELLQKYSAVAFQALSISKSKWARQTLSLRLSMDFIRGSDGAICGALFSIPTKLLVLTSVCTVRWRLNDPVLSIFLDSSCTNLPTYFNSCSGPKYQTTAFKQVTAAIAAVKQSF